MPLSMLSRAIFGTRATCGTPLHQAFSGMRQAFSVMCADKCGGHGVRPLMKIGMCFKKNYSDSPSNEYSRHYSAESQSESEYLRRQNMNSKLGEKQKKKKEKVITSVGILISTQIRIKSKKRSK